MIFSDSVFFVFFGVFFAFYLLTARSLRLQNVLILVASYVFYGWWDPRFLMLIAASTVMDYVAGLAIAMEQGVFGLIIILFLIFEPDGLAHRWKMIKAYWKLYPFSY